MSRTHSPRFVPLRRALFSVLVCAALGAGASLHAAEGEEPAGEPAAQEVQMSGKHARVAQGGRVELAASAFSDEELAGRRPQYERLKPKVRDNVR